MKKTILLFIASVLLSITSALAQGGTTGPLTWEINNGTLTISGEGEMPDYNGDQPWYDYKDDIHTLVIESGVSSIGYDAFSYFDNLTSVTISNTVLSINDYAFAHCEKLPSILFPDGLKSIADWAFVECSALTSVFLSKSVITIEPTSFARCYSLTSIEVDSENTGYASENGILFNKDKSAIICYPAGKGGSYVIPNSVKTIGDGAFYFCTTLTAITIPNNVTSIGAGAFISCTSLTSLTIPNGVTSIGVNTFLYCTNLTSVTIPSSVTSIGQSAFNNCTSLISITIPAGVTSIGGSAFRSCTSITSIVIPNSVTTIGDNAFNDCTNLISIAIPTGVTSIEWCTFLSCTSLTSIDIPNSVTTIEYNAFGNCTNLTSITIPKSTISIGHSVFDNCTNLHLITNLNPVPVDISSDVFNGVDPSACTLKVSMGSVAAYKEAEVWKLFNIVGINVGIVETDNYPSLRVYPNPTTGVLNLIQESINNEQLTINNVEIFDIYGRKHHISYLTSHISNHQINISHLPAGLYFVRITTETGVVMQKIVKQ